MRKFNLLVALVMIASLLLFACAPQPSEPAEPAPEEPAEPTAAPVEEEEEEEVAPAGLSCEEPIKVGLITDATGMLAIYGAHIIRSFMLGMEYATGAAGSVGDVFTVPLYTQSVEGPEQM